MHDQDKNILKKYNILCVVVTVKRLLLRFYIYEDNKLTDISEVWIKPTLRFRKELGLVKSIWAVFLLKAVVSGKV